jgi:hypothetical protein
MALLFIQGLGGLAGGAALTARPSGSIMKMPVSYLHGSPFSDYLIPGLILTLVLGVFPLVILAGIWRSGARSRAWAWYGSFAVGCGLVIWVLVEITIIPYNILQPVFGAVGVLIALTTLLAPVRRYCGVVVSRNERADRAAQPSS